MKRVRYLRFDRRSSLPTSAACVVANGARETLSALLDAPATLRLCEPSIPSPRAWPAIARDALLYRVRGAVADAALVFGAADAASLAAGVFGEAQCSEGARALSAIESEMLDRTVAALAANLTAVCGPRDGRRVERIADLAGFVTYFELMIEEPIAARIGVALSRDPAPEPRCRVEIGQLRAVPVRAAAAIELGTVEARVVRALGVGTLVPLHVPDLERCSLRVHGRRIATGSSGVRNGRFALNVGATSATANRL